MVSSSQEYNGHTIVLAHDEYAESPRDWDNLGEFLYIENRSVEGDRKASLEYIEALTKRDDVVYLPVYAYVHSGVTIRTSPFECSFDSGMVGIIYVYKDRLAKEGLTEEQAKETLKSEIDTMAKWLEGQVFGYVVKRDGNEIDSCWGMYDHEEALTRAKEFIDSISPAELSLESSAL